MLSDAAVKKILCNTAVASVAEKTCELISDGQIANEQALRDAAALDDFWLKAKPVLITTGPGTTALIKGIQDTLTAYEDAIALPQ